MNLYTAQQSKCLDQSSEELGVSAKTLMANAGWNIAKLIWERAKPGNGPIVFLIGKGNNGGDGLVAANHLKEKHFQIILIKSKADFQKQAENLKKAGWIVDGLLGVGLQGDVRGWIAEVIPAVNQLKRKVLAIDIPSGLDADKGVPLGCAIQATLTACLAGVKLGCLLYPGCDYAGEIQNIDIGIPKPAYEKLENPYHLLEPHDFNRGLKPRPKDSHKKDFGHVLVVAGSKGMPGAGFLAAMAALRAGCGMVTYALPEGAYQKFESQFAEVMVQPISDGGSGIFTEKSFKTVLEQVEGKNTVLLGPGLGTDPATISFVHQLIPRIRQPMVIDADALNAIAQNSAFLEQRLGPTLLTPHPGEMARLLGISIREVQNDRIATAMQAAQKWKLCLILKGYRTLIATFDGKLYVNPTGNPGMATAGMGDVLAGVISGFMAQGLPASDAALAGVYLHGMAGDMAKEEKGEKGLIASDISAYIPKALKGVQSGPLSR